MNQKHCPGCDTTKPLSEFRWRNKAAGLVQYHCKTCCKKQGKKHYDKNRAAQIQKQQIRSIRNREDIWRFKNTLKCSNCGENNVYCLDFHHLDPSRKERQISELRYATWDTFKKELVKCVCVCANCHRKIHGGDLYVKQGWNDELLRQIEEFEPRKV